MSQLCRNEYGIEFDLDIEIGNARQDERMMLGKAFMKLYGSEYSWSEVVELAEQLKEQKNE